LEAVAEALVEFTPAIARPMLQELAASRDPGVLAAVLDALALHVQHARALPTPVRERLLRAPFELDEAPSLEARLNAIQLARALGTAPPTSTTSVRAVRQALQPDAQVTTTVTVPETALDEGDLVITTTVGRIVIRIDGRSARQAARVVTEAARSGRYNGTVFHRIVPAFVAQGGDPRGDGYGGTSTIVPTELSGERFERGAVGIALAGLDTGGMQFFIVTADSPHLDARYPWIGRVVEGIEVVDELMIGDAMQRVEFVAR
jgi:cyclophilin family peptidyl-prolyl cis-trans isomerase